MQKESGITLTRVPLKKDIDDPVPQDNLKGETLWPQKKEKKKQ